MRKKMTPNFLQKVITAHYIWLESNEKSGQYAKLYYTDLDYIDLSNTKLCFADLCHANLIGTNLRNADLRHANLTNANLQNADLRNADLSGADLRWAILDYVTLSNAKGLLSPTDWMDKNFQKNNKGYIVFKRIGEGKTEFPPPDHWTIKEGFYLTEIVNEDRRKNCSHGINFGTREWCENRYTHADLWKCLLEFDDLEKLVVPYATDGKARCGRLKLIRKGKKN